MAVCDRWHKTRPRPGEPTCAEHGRPPTIEHGTGDRWQARWRDDTGRQRKQNFVRKADADRHDNAVRASLTAGTYVDASAGRVRFRDFADNWRSLQVHRESTQVIIERGLRLHINPVIGDLQLGAIRPAHIQRLVRQMTDDLSAATVAVTYGFLASMFRSAVRDRLIARSPCDDIRRPGRDRGEVWIPDAGTIEAVAGAMAERYRMVPRLAARSGLRPSELFGLEVSCVDFLRRSLRVNQQIATTVPGNVPYLAPVKTPQSNRTVPLTTATVDMLAAHLARFPAAAFELEDRTDPRHPVTRTAAFVFSTPAGRPIVRSTWGGIWTPAARKAGLPEGTGLHCCRHFYASALIRFGESVKTVQKLLGHSSARVTLDTYAHVWPDSADRTRQAVDSAFADVPVVCPDAEGSR